MSIFKLASTGVGSIKESHKGRLHEYLNIPEGEKIPTELLQDKLKSETDPLRRRQLNYALVARRWKKK